MVATYIIFRLSSHHVLYTCMLYKYYLLQNMKEDRSRFPEKEFKYFNMNIKPHTHNEIFQGENV